MSIALDPRVFPLCSVLIAFFVTQQRVELNPRHVGVGDIGDMASRTFGCGRFLGSIRVRQGMMPECEEAPVIGLRKALTVFYCYVDPVVLTVEIPASGRFLTRAVWKIRFKDSRQLLYDDRSFWKLACL